MPTLGKPKPRLLKYTSKPDNVGASEVAKAEPVYISGLPGADLSVKADAASGLEAAADLQALAEALSARIKALEDAAE